MRIKHFSHSSFYRQLAILGFASLSACVCQVSAADLGPQSGGDIVLNNDDIVVATSPNHVGITSATTGIVDLADGVTINVTSGSGIGIYTYGTNNDSVLTANRLTINVDGTGGFGTGISIGGDSLNVDLGTDSKISVQNGSGIDLSSRTATFKAEKLTIETSGAQGIGINFRQGASVDLGSGSVITTNGSDSHGIYSLNGGSFEADALTINALGDQSGGLVIDQSSGDVGGTANVGAGSAISSSQWYAVSVFGSGSVLNYKGTNDNRNTLSSERYSTATSMAHSTLNLAYTDVRVGSGWFGLYAQDYGTIVGENVTIDGSAGATVGVYALRDSQIDLSGDIVIDMGDIANWAIGTQDNSGAGYAASRVNADGKLAINGAVVSKGGIINLNMRSGSVWTGRADSDNVNGGLLNVTMQDSRWNLPVNSWLDTLALTNSTVDFASSAQSSSGYSTLYVTDLSGSGTFVMRTDIVGDGDGVNNSGDLLKVTGTSSGSHLLTINNQGSMATTGNEVLTVVETTDGAATFTATSKVELGGYLYDVRQNGNNWELYASGSLPEPMPDPSSDTNSGTDFGTGSSSTPAATTTADAGGNYLNVGYLMNYAENQTLMQRMGDLRQSGGKGNVWIRGYGGKFDAFASGKLSGFDMGYSGIQFGADKRISVETPLFIGLFMGSTHASPDYRGGDGTASSDYMGMYASYMAQGGFYSDLMLKASRQKNSFNVLDSQNNGVNADGSASGFSASLEAGQKFSLNQSGNGFYIEPQAQFTYGHQNAMSMKASNGLNIDLSSYESMLGRASVLLGYETAAGNSQVNVYLKTGGIREFSGDTDYRLNGSKEKHSFKGNGWNNGLGVSAQVNKQHSLYLEVDYTNGNGFDQRQVNGGYRFSF